MMYNEFLEISGEDYNVTTGEIYMYEIEPVYQCSPESMFKSKQDFIKWWKNNKELCKWMSSVLRMKDNMQKDMDGMMRQKVELEEKNHELEMKINGLEQDVEEKDNYIKEREKYWKEQMDAVQLKANEEILTLKVRALFAPDELIKELKLAMFDNYESIKKFAVEKGIVKES